MGSGGSNSLREQLKLVWKQTGKKPKELEELLDLPESTREVFDHYLGLHNTRSYHMGGANPISYSEILAYCTLQNIELNDMELHLIRLLDNTALEYIAKETSKSTVKTSKRNK